MLGAASLTAEKKNARKRVVSGMRPTGPLHIGHFFGAISNWLKLQEEYDCFFFVADWHALTTHYADTSSVADNTLQVAMDWLSCGIDSEKSTVFIQSSVPEHAELHLLLSMITPLGWLERVPTYKEQIENLRDKNLGTYGFLGYPLLQTADIVIYDADLVPVGEDQVPHVELSREVVRRFNTNFGVHFESVGFRASDPEAVRKVCEWLALPDPMTDKGMPRETKTAGASIIRSALHKAVGLVGIENFIAGLPDALKGRIKTEAILAEPHPLLTETPRLPGTDGRRMAKSYANAIWLSEPVDSIRQKVRNMMTDPARVRRTDPGNPDVCPVFSYHKLFSNQPTIDMVNHECRVAGIGCVDCKKIMADGLIRWIEPIQARRCEFEAHPRQVWDILGAGSAAARKTARRTMKRVRKAIFHWEEARQGSSSAAHAAVAAPALEGSPREEK